MLLGVRQGIEEGDTSVRALLSCLFASSHGFSVISSVQYDA